MVGIAESLEATFNEFSNTNAEIVEVSKQNGYIAVVLEKDSSKRIFTFGQHRHPD